MSLRAADVLLAFLATAVLVFMRNRRNGRSPPGPRGLPLIGNALQIPLEEPRKVFAEWGRRWGAFPSRNIAYSLCDDQLLLRRASAGFHDGAADGHHQFFQDCVRPIGQTQHYLL